VRKNKPEKSDEIFTVNYGKIKASLMKEVKSSIDLLLKVE